MSAILRLVMGRKGWLSNLESIAGVLAAALVILGLQKLGFTLSDGAMGAILGTGVLAGNQLLGNLDFFRRWDRIIFPDLPHTDLRPDDTLDDARK